MIDPAISPQPASVGSGASLPALMQGRIEGPSEFAEVIRLAFATAARQGWRELIMSDASFQSWPLGERAVAQSLHDWAKTGRTLTILARNYDELIRRHARFVTWRRTWSHIVVCRANASIAEDDFPSALWSPVWCCQKLDKARSTGLSDFDPGRRVAIREHLSECLRRSSPAFPATTLGL
jgi:hypothetical protein